MKKFHILAILIFTSINCFSQTNCSNAQAHIFYAFNNAKDGLDSNNLTDVKYYGKKTLESFKNVQSVLGTCDCENVENFTYESIQKLSKVAGTEKMSDAKYYVAKAKEYAQKIITILDYCTVSGDSSIRVEINQDLGDLKKEQLKLNQQQEALLVQQEKLKIQLEKQKKEALYIEKQQLIITADMAISKNIEAYNDVLKACQCNNSIPITSIKQNNELISKSVDEIKTYYINSIKDLTSNYMTMLNTCDNESEN